MDYKGNNKKEYLIKKNIWKIRLDTKVDTFFFLL